MRASRQAGQNLVELALSMTLLMAVALGLLDFGRVMFIYTGITNSAREGARYAALLSGAACTSGVANIRSLVQAEQPYIFTATELTDTTGAHRPDIQVDCTQADRRTVTVKYWFKPVTFFIADMLDNPNGSHRIPISTRATMPVVAAS